MTPLTQQLEDKKKGCGNDTKYMHGMNTLLDKKCGEYPFKDKGLPIIYCPTCKAEIAILEQAIAEIKKQRQNFIDIINSLGEIRGKSNDLQCIKLGESFSTNSVEWLKKELLKQLNQPKEERKE